jgi:hypothetical protein
MPTPHSSGKATRRRTGTTKSANATPDGILPLATVPLLALTLPRAHVCVKENPHRLRTGRAGRSSTDQLLVSTKRHGGPPPIGMTGELLAPLIARILRSRVGSPGWRELPLCPRAPCSSRGKLRDFGGGAGLRPRPLLLASVDGCAVYLGANIR